MTIVAERPKGVPSSSLGQQEPRCEAPRAYRVVRRGRPVALTRRRRASAPLCQPVACYPSPTKRLEASKAAAILHQARRSRPRFQIKMRKPLECGPGPKLSLVIICVSLSIESRIPRGVVVVLAVATLPSRPSNRARELPTHHARSNWGSLRPSASIRANAGGVYMLLSQPLGPISAR